MGCTQSTERKPVAAAEAKPTAAAEPRAEPVVAAAPVAVDAVAPEPQRAEQPAEPKAEPQQEEEAGVIVIESVQVTEPSPVIAAEEPTPAAPVQAVAPAEPTVVVAAVAAPSPAAPAENPKENAAPAAAPKKEARAALTPIKAKPVVPVLSLIASPNVVPNKTAGKRSARGTAVTVVPEVVAAKKSVAFGTSLPVPVDAAKQRKSRVRKAAGKHYASVQEDILLASIAAFERQLTHRNSLDSQLRS